VNAEPVIARVVEEENGKSKKKHHWDQMGCFFFGVENCFDYEG
jgi:hypothetical protein